jgi:hypothetical protein
MDSTSTRHNIPRMGTPRADPSQRTPHTKDFPIVTICPELGVKGVPADGRALVLRRVSKRTPWLGVWNILHDFKIVIMAWQMAALASFFLRAYRQLIHFYVQRNVQCRILSCCLDTDDRLDCECVCVQRNRIDSPHACCRPCFYGVGNLAP